MVTRKQAEAFTPNHSELAEPRLGAPWHQRAAEVDNPGMASQFMQRCIYNSDQATALQILRRARHHLAADPGNLAWRSILAQWANVRIGQRDTALTDTSEFDQLLATHEITPR